MTNQTNHLLPTDCKLRKAGFIGRMITLWWVVRDGKEIVVREERAA